VSASDPHRARERPLEDSQINWMSARHKAAVDLGHITISSGFWETGPGAPKAADGIAQHLFFNATPAALKVVARMARARKPSIVIAARATERCLGRA
jgi:hypothetical protein